MKKIFLLFVFMVNLYSLDQLSALPEENKKVLNWVLEDLGLDNASSDLRSKIYDKFSFGLENGWYSTFINNSSLANSKVGNADTKFVEMSLVNNNRVYSITFIHFKKEKQITVITRQYIPADSKLSLEKFDEFKKDTNYEVKNETEYYAYLREKGYMSDTIISIKDDYGMISYIDVQIINL